jgi:hypothetical protein
VCLSNCYIITDYFNILIVFWAEFSDQVDEYNLHKKDPVLSGDVLRAVTSVHARFLPTHLSGQTHICKWGCPLWKQVTSKHAKRTLAGSGDQACLFAAFWFAHVGGSNKKTC